MTDAAILGMLRLLTSHPKVTQREIAHELGVSLGKANYCVRALLVKGLVKAQNFRRSDNKRGYIYALTAKGVAAKAELTRSFLAQKQREYAELRREIERLELEANGF